MEYQLQLLFDNDGNCINIISDKYLIEKYKYKNKYQQYIFHIYISKNYAPIFEKKCSMYNNKTIALFKSIRLNNTSIEYISLMDENCIKCYYFKNLKDYFKYYISYIIDAEVIKEKHVIYLFSFLVLIFHPICYTLLVELFNIDNERKKIIIPDWMLNILNEDHLINSKNAIYELAEYINNNIDNENLKDIKLKYVDFKISKENKSILNNNMNNFINSLFKKH